MKESSLPALRAVPILPQTASSGGLGPMKRFVPVGLLLGALMSAAPAYAETPLPNPAAKPVPLMAPNAVEFTLKNGMQVVVIPDHRAPVVTHMVWYRVG